MRTIIGLLDNANEAQDTIRDLKQIGLRADQISVVCPEASIGREMQGVTLEPLSVKGLGHLAAGGPVTEFLTPSAAQSNPEAFVTALMNLGVSRAESVAYIDAIKNGYTLEAAIVDDERAGEALAIMQEHSREREQQPGHMPPVTSARAEETKIPVVEEELVVGKREVVGGGVRVSTHVIERPVFEEITLKREHIDVERRPVDRVVSEPNKAFQEETIEFVTTQEEPVVAKRARVVEEVLVRKDTEEHTEDVRATVRSTDVDIQKLRPFDVTRYQEHFGTLRNRLGEVGDTESVRFENYERAYRFGHELRGEPRYAAGEWTNIEGDVKSTWEERSPGTWERFKEAIRHAWEQAKE